MGGVRILVFLSEYPTKHGTKQQKDFVGGGHYYLFGWILSNQLLREYPLIITLSFCFNCFYLRLVSCTLHVSLLNEHSLSLLMCGCSRCWIIIYLLFFSYDIFRTLVVPLNVLRKRPWVTLRNLPLKPMALAAPPL